VPASIFYLQLIAHAFSQGSTFARLSYDFSFSSSSFQQTSSTFLFFQSITVPFTLKYSIFPHIYKGYCSIFPA